MCGCGGGGGVDRRNNENEQRWSWRLRSKKKEPYTTVHPSWGHTSFFPDDCEVKPLRGWHHHCWDTLYTTSYIFHPLFSASHKHCFVNCASPPHSSVCGSLAIFRPGVVSLLVFHLWVKSILRVSHHKEPPVVVRAGPVLSHLQTNKWNNVVMVYVPSLNFNSWT